MLDELLQRKLNIERIKALADKAAPAIPNLEMSHEQQGKFIEFLQRRAPRKRYVGTCATQ